MEENLAKTKLFLLTGEEIGLKEDFIRKIKNKLNLEVVHLWGDEVSADQILRYIYQIPLFSKDQLILVHSWELQKDKEKKLLVEGMERYKDGVNLLVLLFNSPLFRLPQFIKDGLEKKGLILDFSTPNEEELRMYIEEKIKEQGYKIEEEAKDLITYLLSDTGILYLNQELEKLFLCLKKGELISNSKVKELLFPTFAKISTIIKLFEKKRYDDILSIFPRNYEPTAILFYLSKEINRLYQKKYYLSSKEEKFLEKLVIFAYITDFLLKSYPDVKLKDLILEYYFLLKANMLHSGELP
jgi:DNA polymerase III delta subunit